MTRLRVVSRTGAMSAVVLLLPEQTTPMEAHVASAHGSDVGNPNAANTPDTEPSPSRTIHMGSESSAG